MNTVEIFSEHEKVARQILIEHYRKSYRERVEQQVDLLLALDGYVGRFNYLFSILGDRRGSLSKILISGYSAGSEMIVARQFGFEEIHGVEVVPALFDATRARLAGIPGMFPVLYNGSDLPYEDESFDLVVSGHIIEHTESPAQYLSELIRVLKSNGILYIEFPTRYHYIELHTGLISFEWLPVPLRNSIVGMLSSRFSILKPHVKARYASLLTTHLQQVSRRDIRRMLKEMNIEYKEIAHAMPVPGIVRCIIEKLKNNI
jgi:SAM-dependent methyltransferase